MGKEKLKETNEKCDPEIKSYGVGIRHLQMFCMTFTVVSLIIARASMGIAVLAMSDNGHHQKIPSNDTRDSNLSVNYINNDIYDDVTEHIDVEALINDTNERIFDNGTYGNDSHENITDTGIMTFNWDKKTQSLILSSFFWGYVWMQIPAGIIAKKFGGKPIMLTALLTNSFICCLVPTFAAVGGWMLVCACRVCMGLTQSCLFPATHTLLGQWLPENERTSYVGIVYAGIQLGTIIAMPLCGVLADTSLGWKLIFYVIAGLLFFNSIVWYFFAGSTPREHKMISKEERQYIEAGLNVSEVRPPTPWKHILKSGPVWALLAPHFGYVMSFVLFFVDMPTYLEKALQLSLKDSSLLSALPYIGMWIGSVFSSFLSEWLCNRGLISLTVSRKLFQSIAQFGVAIGLVILSFLGPESKTLAVVTIVGILTACGFASAGFIINQLDLSPNFAGVIISLLNFIANFGTVLMPITTSFILQNDSSNVPRWRWVFLIMAGISISTNIVYLVFGTSKRQDWDDPKFLSKEAADPEETQPVLEKGENKETEEKTDESEKKL